MSKYCNLSESYTDKNKLNVKDTKRSKERRKNPFDKCCLNYFFLICPSILLFHHPLQ